MMPYARVVCVIVKRSGRPAVLSMLQKVGIWVGSVSVPDDWWPVIQRWMQD